MVVLPAPEGPTSAVVVPGAAREARRRRGRPSARVVLEADVLERQLGALRRVAGGRSTGVRRVDDVRAARRAASSICSMSMKAWRISR